MTEFQKMGQQNAAARGYIMRTLVRCPRNCMPVRRISDLLQTDGYTMDADIGNHLAYLHELEYIKFLKSSITPYNAYAMNGIVGLTHKGIQFIERGGDMEAGIEL